MTDEIRLWRFQTLIQKYKHRYTWRNLNPHVMARYLTLFIKALLPRFLFIGHGLVCLWVAYLVEKNSAWWGLSACLVVIVVEGVYNVLVRKGKEFDWVCPSAFFYSIVLLTSLISFRRDQVQCIADSIADGSCKVINDPTAGQPTKFVLQLNMGMKALVIEQTGVLMLIIGRWTLPKGSISRNQFSQILLIYIATAADIVEFSEVYTIEIVRERSDRAKIYNEVMGVWGWSVMQFSLTIALPEDGLKQEDEEDENAANAKWRQTNRVAPISYQHYKAMLTKGWDAEAQKNVTPKGVQWRGGKFEVSRDERSKSEGQVDANENTGCCIGKGEWKECLARNMELITCLIPVLMQDGPFFGYRMVLIIRYKVITPMIILLTVKNALVIIVQIYRIVILYCFEPPEGELDVNDPSVRVRAALKATSRDVSFAHTRSNIQAIQAISRMQAASHRKSETVA